MSVGGGLERECGVGGRVVAGLVDVASFGEEPLPRLCDVAEGEHGVGVVGRRAEVGALGDVDDALDSVVAHDGKKVEVEAAGWEGANSRGNGETALAAIWWWQTRAEVREDQMVEEEEE